MLLSFSCVPFVTPLFLRRCRGLGSSKDLGQQLREGGAGAVAQEFEGEGADAVGPAGTREGVGEQVEEVV